MTWLGEGLVLALLYLPDGDRPFAGRVFQFAYYNRVLTHTTNGDRWLTAGEVHTNHLMGSAW